MQQFKKNFLRIKKLLSNYSITKLNVFNKNVDALYTILILSIIALYKFISHNISIFYIFLEIQALFINTNCKSLLYFKNILISVSLHIITFFTKNLIVLLPANIIILLIFLFFLAAILIIIRGGSPRYRIEQLSQFNFSKLFPIIIGIATLIILISLFL